MAQTEIVGVHPVNAGQTNTPNHFIVWLDKYIGEPNECVLLKCSLFMAMDPTTLSFERELNEDDVNKSIRYDTPILVQLDQVEFLFQAFVDVEKCFLTIKDHIDTRKIILITSGSKGRILVPSLIANFENAFGPTNRIYVFCANTLMQEVEGVDPPSNTWILGFLECLLIFNHQDDLFARMISDMADYFFCQAQKYDQTQYLDSACNNYRWSKLMYQRYEKLEPVRRTATIEDIDRRINDIEQRRNPHNNIDDDDDDPIGTEDS